MAKNRLKRKSASGGTTLKPPSENTVSYDDFKPRFSLEFLQPDFCLSKCNQQEKASFADAIHKRSQLTWSQIKSQHRKKLGFEKISRNSLDAPVPMFVTDDTDMLAFRFNGKAPMVGYRKKATSYVMWLDRAFKLYDHG